MNYKTRRGGGEDSNKIFQFEVRSMLKQLKHGKRNSRSDAFNASTSRRSIYHGRLRGWCKGEDVTVVERETPASRILPLNGETC